MQNSESPLKKYRREPKLYIDLPSKGAYYPPGSLNKAEELEVYSMTAVDEIAVKTPDALFTGNAIARLIQRCIPEIKDPWNMPMMDLNHCLTAIRMATYGNKMSVSGKCPSCEANSDYEIDLQNLITHFGTIDFKDHINVKGFNFDLRPLTYREYTQLQKQSFVFQRQVVQQIPKIEDEDARSVELQKIYDQLADLRIMSVLQTVVRIEINGEEETDINEIVDFIENNDKDYFNKITSLSDKNRESWNVPPVDVACNECNEKYKLSLDLDYSSFFEQP